MARTSKILLGVVVAVAVGVLVFWQIRDQEPLLDPGKVEAGLPRRAATVLAAHPTLSPTPEGDVYVALRAGGVRVGEAWAGGISWRHAAVTAVTRALAEHPEREQDIDALEICVPHSYESQRVRRKRTVLPNALRGIAGIELVNRDKSTRHCPTDMVARNQSFGDIESDFRRGAGIAEEQYLDETSARSFGAHQLLVGLSERDTIRPMFRGNTIVPMSAVHSEGVRRLAKGMGDWLVNQLQPNGRMVYMYWPSNGRESSGNNMIRQYMASLCLVRLARWRDDPQLMALAERNIRYNFSRFFRMQGEHGLITFRGRSKLGAAALAALGIVEAPFREALANYEKPIYETTKFLQQPDGRFITFYGTNSHDNANFYPGETLLLWATMYQKAQDPDLLERFMRAFRFYKEWHLENRNPAFVPWHVQAYYRMWEVTRDQDLADYIFVMCDWLVDYQEWDTAPFPDMLGRFYDPDRPQFGVPHASSTGVYLEGLIDAYRLAKALGDEGRMASYKRTILRGLRMLMQLQFEDDIDMFYVSKRKAVEGGIRTTVYNNTIRVDNVQHGLMAILRIIDEFDAHDSW